MPSKDKRPKKTDDEKAAEAKEKANGALQKACKLGDTKMSLKSAESAVAKGAEVNLQFGEKDNTPMHLAALFGSLQIMVYLHGLGADLTIKNKLKRTPLESAQHVGEEQAVTVLEMLAAGRSIDLSKLAVDDSDEEDEDVPKDVLAEGAAVAALEVEKVAEVAAIGVAET